MNGCADMECLLIQHHVGVVQGRMVRSACSFAVLNKDVLEVPSEDIDTVAVCATYIDGKQVYAYNETIEEATNRG